MTPPDLDRTSALFLDVDGTLVWQTKAAPAGPPGSRSTPTIDGDNIYLLAANGQIGCYDAHNGEKKWSHEAKEFGGSPGAWAYAESVLIYKNMAIFKPGGRKCIVALDKTSGETIWTSSGFDAGPEYSSSIVVTFQGQPMIVTGTGTWSGLRGIISGRGRKILLMISFRASGKIPVNISGELFSLFFSDFSLWRKPVL